VLCESLKVIIFWILMLVVDVDGFLGDVYFVYWVGEVECTL